MNNFVFDDMRHKRNYDIAVMSAIGKRESQQDAAYVAATDDDVFAVVCDGMGGVSGGQIASSTAVEAFVEYYQLSGQQGLSNSEWLQKAAETGDDIVYCIKNSDGKRIGAGTTLLSVVVHENELNWVSVGDSRIYIIRGHEIVQVTNDHNYFMRLDQQKAAGLITQEKYREESRQGEALISFIGMGGLSMMDVNEEALKMQPGDVILLCTDGLYRALTAEEISIIVNESSNMQEAAAYLRKLIVHRDCAYQDNYTYVLIKNGRGL